MLEPERSPFGDSPVLMVVDAVIGTTLVRDIFPLQSLPLQQMYCKFTEFKKRSAIHEDDLEYRVPSNECKNSEHRTLIFKFSEKSYVRL
jgi:hypothetical protein